MIFNTGRLRLLSATSRGESSHFMTSGISQLNTTISFRIAGTSDGILAETYKSGRQFGLCFLGFRFTNPQTGVTHSAFNLFNEHIDPSVVYIGRHPFLDAQLGKYSHTQPEITDKAFEDKACRALEKYFLLHSQGTVRHNNSCREHSPAIRSLDGWRVLTTDDGKDVAEWKGIWKSPNGHVYFLEAKHLMDFDKLHAIHEKLEQSRLFLGLERPNVTGFLASNHWQPGVCRVAQCSTYGFSVSTFDLTVLEPSLD